MPLFKNGIGKQIITDYNGYFFLENLNCITKKTMDITCNGTRKSVETGITLTDLVDSFELNPQTLVAEVNGRIIEHGGFKDTKLQDGDSVELIRFVGGG